MLFCQIWYDQLQQLSHLLSQYKKSISIATQKFISDGDVIFIAHGSTTSNVVSNIDKKIITIITDGIDIIHVCFKKENIRIISIGGIINLKTMQIEKSPSIYSDLSNININKLIMGADGISDNVGITSNTYEGMNHILDVAFR